MSTVQHLEASFHDMSLVGHGVQLTLGDFIRLLKKLPANVLVVGFGTMQNSWWEPKKDLVFSRTGQVSSSIGDLLTRCMIFLDQQHWQNLGFDTNLLDENALLWIHSHCPCPNRYVAVTGLSFNGSEFRPLTNDTIVARIPARCALHGM